MLLGLNAFYEKGQSYTKSTYTVGSAYLMSSDVIEFIGTFEIPQHLSWDENVTNALWLNLFRVTKLQMADLPGYSNGIPLTVPNMKREWWLAIDEDSIPHFSFG